MHLSERNQNKDQQLLLMVQISQVESIRARAADGLTIRDKSGGAVFYVKNA